MATENTTRFEELTKLATDFVTTRKGLWDHAAWTDFVSSVQTKGFDISGEMQSKLGDMLEAMKQLYVSAVSTESMENAMKAVVNDSVAFVKQHKGVWGHSEWEDFVKTVRQNTHSLSEGTTGYLGGVLESIKVFYGLTPVVAVQKRASTARAKSLSASQPALAAEKKAETKPVHAAPARAKVASKPTTRAPEKPVPKASVKPTAKTSGKAVPKVSDKPSPKSPEKQDDLTAIDGIGPALAKKLNGAGISSYAQLAALSDDDIKRLEKDIIRFSGRIKRDDWVGQAKALSQY